MQRTRRALLAGVGAAGVAGCLGGASGPDCGTPTGTERVRDQSPPALGAASAPVRVAVWEDFSCPHCGTFAREVTPKLRERYVADGRVRFVRHDFPIPVEAWAWPAASAARHALAVGDAAAYFAFADAIYEARTYDEAVAADAAEAAGIDACPAINAGGTDRYRPAVERDKRRGTDRGVEGTPTVFVDGERVSFDGEIGVEPVQAAIERAL